MEDGDASDLFFVPTPLGADLPLDDTLECANDEADDILEELLGATLYVQSSML